MSWGKELWDGQEAVEKHTKLTTDVMEKYASFVKDRIQTEKDYAKSLRKLAKQYQLKEKNKDDFDFSYMRAFRDVIQESDYYAGQRERIAEILEDGVLKNLNTTISKTKSERKKHLNELESMMSNLESAQKAVKKAKKEYEKAVQELQAAQRSLEEANNNQDSAKPSEVGQRESAVANKTKNMDKCKHEYISTLESFNNLQEKVYETDLPSLLDNKLQVEEERRITQLSELFKGFVDAQRVVLPTIDRILSEIEKAAETCNAVKDTKIFINHNKTGYFPPRKLQFQEYGTPRELPTNSHPPLKKGTGIKSKLKRKVVKKGFADDFSDLPPEQKKRMLNTKIQETEAKLNQLTKVNEGLEKMADASRKSQSKKAKSHGEQIQLEFDANAKEISRITTLLHQYQAFLEAVEGQGVPQSYPAPGNQAQGNASEVTSVQPQDEYTEGWASDEFDDIKCKVLFEFQATNADELTVEYGEELDVIKDDDGCGWTLVARGEEQGYVPSSYIKDI